MDKKYKIYNVETDTKKIYQDRYINCFEERSQWYRKKNWNLIEIFINQNTMLILYQSTRPQCTGIHKDLLQVFIVTLLKTSKMRSNTKCSSTGWQENL